ncbi:MAG: hypothetical protein ACOY9D_03905 [Pseudomonadota bacterium]
MPNLVKENFLSLMRQKFGAISKLANSNSLFDVGNGIARIYIRYSKVHEKGVTFYGLRKEDLKHIEGRPSFLVFLWDKQEEPLFVPFSAYEQIFKFAEPASDGQYKAQILLNEESTTLYLARVGKFNLEGLFGWGQLLHLFKSIAEETTPELSHSQVQTFLSVIGASKGYDIWVPQNDRNKLDKSLIGTMVYRESLPSTLNIITEVAEEIDVVWLQKGSNQVRSLFEVEHTTPIYTALLRFNDVHLAAPNPAQSFQIIAQDSRRPAFVRQLNRPTFKASGLNQICTFLEYSNVYSWFQRLQSQKPISALHLGGQ